MNIFIRYQQKRDPKQMFLIYFADHAHIDLDAFIRTLQNQYALTVIRGTGTNFQTIKIAIRPSQLRKLQDSLPARVLVSYELLESETC